MNQPLDLTITKARRPRRRVRTQRTIHLVLLGLAGGLIGGTIAAVIFL